MGITVTCLVGLDWLRYTLDVPAVLTDVLPAEALVVAAVGVIIGALTTVPARTRPSIVVVVYHITLLGDIWVVNLDVNLIVCVLSTAGSFKKNLTRLLLEN